MPTLDETEVGVIKVKSSASAPATATAIVFAFNDGPNVTLRAIGASAVNQATKAIAIASGHLGAKGLTLRCRIGFEDRMVPPQDGSEGPEREVTSVVWRLEAA